MELSNLVHIINIKKIYNYNKNKTFSSITSNSQLTNKETIFIYDCYSKIKKKYIEEAIKNKVPAIISNKYLKSVSIPQFIVSNIKTEIDLLLKKLYIKLPNKTVAITGTNGKTSVVWYISKILTLLNINNSTVGTLGHFINSKKKNNVNLTTPAYEELYKYGCLNKKNNYFYIFEASSHALDQNRLRNYPIDIAAITNVSNDHLDYHKTFSNYKNSKLKLFTKYLDKRGFAIINSRIKNKLFLTKNINKKKIKINYFGNKSICLRNKNNLIYLYLNKKKYNIGKMKLTTKIELENLECAISCCLSLNISQNKIIKVLPKINNPPGRLQEVNFKKKNSKIIIDYAHTPDALKKVLQSLKVNNIKPILLFGCGGERDISKRKLMGIIANKYASKVYITDDNPRNENASKIRKDLLKYCPKGQEFYSRKKAIKFAIKNLKYNQTLVIAGKGHEKFQIVKNKKINFDDVQVVKNYIK